MYLVDGTEHLGCAGDPLYCPSQDVQRKLQPLQDAAAFTVQTQSLQCLKTHTILSTSSDLLQLLHSQSKVFSCSHVSSAAVYVKVFTLLETFRAVLTHSNREF